MIVICRTPTEAERVNLTVSGHTVRVFTIPSDSVMPTPIGTVEKIGSADVAKRLRQNLIAIIKTACSILRPEAAAEAGNRCIGHRLKVIINRRVPSRGTAIELMVPAVGILTLHEILAVVDGADGGDSVIKWRSVAYV